VWQNDGPPLPPDPSGGCSPEQWAQSPGACAGPQGADEPDPYMRPPNPNKCDKGDQPPDEPPDQPPPDQPPVIPPLVSDKTCLNWTLADAWMAGFVEGSALFGQEELAAPVAVIELGSLGAHRIVCGNWFDF
ncbi:MAG: hypothetical protein WAK62_18200, partial [Terriglobales bacterium]